MPILDLMFATSIIRAWKTIPKKYPEGYYLCAMEDSAKGIYSHSTVARTIILCPAVQATVKDDN